MPAESTSGHVAAVVHASRWEEAATAVEYAIMVSLIALVIFGAVAALGGTTNELYDCAASAVDALPETTSCS